MALLSPLRPSRLATLVLAAAALGLAPAGAAAQKAAPPPPEPAPPVLFAEQPANASQWMFSVRDPLGIVGGYVPGAGIWPWVASLDIAGFRCGGTLISPDTVLTAAHCVVGSRGVIKAKKFTVTLGRTDLDDTTVGEEHTLRADPIVHPRWNGDYYRGGDLALLRLATTTEVTPAKIALPGATAASATAMGWGRLGTFAGTSQDLLAVDLALVSDLSCMLVLRSAECRAEPHGVRGRRGGRHVQGRQRRPADDLRRRGRLAPDRRDELRRPGRFLRRTGHPRRLHRGQQRGASPLGDAQAVRARAVLVLVLAALALVPAAAHAQEPGPTLFTEAAPDPSQWSFSVQPQGIVNGYIPSATQWPWMTYLNIAGFACGGALIQPEVVLTAAHCVVGKGRSTPVYKARQATAVIGRRDLLAEGGEVHKVRQIVKHPRYRNPSKRYDVALLHLTAPATPTPALLGDRDTWGQSATAMGWGLTSEGGAPSRQLLAVDLPLIGDETCSSTWAPGYSSSLMVCAGGVTRDTCQGDSGGPLMVPDPLGPRGWLLIGVTSFGHGCARVGFPGVYAWAAGDELRNWILTNSS